MIKLERTFGTHTVPERHFQKMLQLLRRSERNLSRSHQQNCGSALGLPQPLNTDHLPGTTHSWVIWRMMSVPGGESEFSWQLGHSDKRSCLGKWHHALLKQRDTFFCRDCNEMLTKATLQLPNVSKQVCSWIINAGAGVLQQTHTQPDFLRIWNKLAEPGPHIPEQQMNGLICIWPGACMTTTHWRRVWGGLLLPLKWSLSLSFFHLLLITANNNKLVVSLLWKPSWADNNNYLQMILEKLTSTRWAHLETFAFRKWKDAQ